MLKDKIKDIITIKLNQPINPLNFRGLYFSGLADGNILTRLYNNKDLINNYVRIISLEFFFYSDATIWIRELAEDNKVFTANTNSRYSTIQGLTRIEPAYLERKSTNNSFQILVDSNNLNLFPLTFAPAFEKLDLNILPQSTIADGIDIKYNLSFVNDHEANTVLNPSVTCLMLIELLNDINPFLIQDK